VAIPGILVIRTGWYNRHYHSHSAP